MTRARQVGATLLLGGLYPHTDSEKLISQRCKAADAISIHVGSSKIGSPNPSWD